MCFDNLGANVALGFAQSFAATYFCRMCLCTKAETKITFTALPEKYRTKSNYAEAIDIIENSSKIDLQQTKGVREYCVLNDLECFHILENWTVDIMHDLCEGTIRYLLRGFFQLGMTKKVFTEQKIKTLVSGYDVGILNGRFIPSEIRLDAKSLNQSASQMKCLMQHIPFIFHSYKCQPALSDAWICINSMIKILRICYSNRITEQDIDDLEKLIECHLENVKKTFKTDLIPKHHNMTHYPECIRRSGPLCHMSTLRYEMKHKELTSTMKNSTNFKNVTKSVTNKYQLKNVFQKVYTDRIKHTKLKKVDQKFLEKNKELLEQFNGSSIRTTENVKFNSDYYERGLILKHNLNYFAIDHVLEVNGMFYFICTKFDRIKFDEFLVSLEINPSTPQEHLLIAHSELIYKKTHEKKVVDNKTFILSDSLDIF